MTVSSMIPNQGAILLWSTGLLVLFFMLLLAIQDDERDHFIAQIQSELTSSESQWPSSMKTFYERRSFQPLWFVDGKPTPKVDELLEAIEISEENGLIYDSSRFELLHRALDLRHAAKVSTESLPSFELELSNLFLTIATHLHRGQTEPENFHSGWIPDESKFDLVPEEFQRRHGIPTNGILDSRTIAALNVPIEERIEQLIVNMERWRWLPDSLGERHIRVNLPDYSLRAFEAEKSQLAMKIIIGKPTTPSEVFHSHISQIVLAPYWYVPYSIATQEILPILRRDISYLARNQIEVRRNGQTIDPEGISWSDLHAEKFPYRLRQNPGPLNPLGGLRFTIPNEFAIGMHDTPERRLFDQSMRAFSHGCIRLEDPISLAQFVSDDSSWTRKRIEDRITREFEYFIEMQDPVPVYFLYWTAWVDDRGAIHFRDDIYGYDRLLYTVLQKDPQQSVGPPPTNYPLDSLQSNAKSTLRRPSEACIS